MPQPVEFNIDPELLGAIGQLVPSAKSAISPLGYGNVSSLNGAQRHALIHKGLLDSGGAISAAMLRTLRTLAQTNAFTRVRLVVGDKLFEHHVYFSPDESQMVALTTTDDGVLVRDPPPFQLIFENLRQHVGDSIIRVCGFEEEMPAELALSLAGMIDLQRKDFMRTFVEGRAFEPRGHDVPAVAAELSDRYNHVQRFVTLVRTVSEFDADLDRESVAAAMRDLAAAGHVVPQAGGLFSLSKPLSTLASRFLTLDSFLTLNAGRVVAEESLVTVDFLSMQAGVNDLLALDAEGDRVRLECLSAAALLAAANRFLTEPAALKGAVAEALEVARAQQEVPAQRRCAQCGAPLSPGQRFCGQCGATAEQAATQAPARQFCPNCGEPLQPDSKFCMECGARVA